MSERRDLIRVMHHTLVVQPDGYGYSRCQQPGRRLNVTTDLARVTCKRCLKILMVIITVTCRCGLVVGEWENSIAEKYPFSCGRCDDTRRNSYPWTLATRIESRPG